MASETTPFPYQMSYQVPYADTDQMGVVYYANFLVYFERIRTKMLCDLGFPYSRMEACGIALPVAQAKVDYYMPAHFEDILTLSAKPSLLSPVRIRIDCRVHRNLALLAEGYTLHAVFSRERQRPVPLPEEMHHIFIVPSSPRQTGDGNAPEVPQTSAGTDD